MFGMGTGVTSLPSLPDFYHYTHSFENVQRNFKYIFLQN
ncbi:hypothetical protein BACI71_160001 [Bacillus mycoides]|uniref:Uncharacterized protein n=1 Tax=Bacillus mycoides TaxID=1405 RepID=A0A653UHE4_BACMY|nr:hypothetical protein BACI71_160001 [Bacillus mycoides]